MRLMMAGFCTRPMNRKEGVLGHAYAALASSRKAQLVRAN